MLRYVKALCGLSRAAQATLSTAQPLVAALVVDDDPDPARFLLLACAMLAVFLATFAANDVLDHRLDRARFAHEERDFSGFDIDTVGVRHPLARGELPYRVAVMWVVGLGALGTAVTAWLSPVSFVVLVVAVALEVAYCKLATVSALKCLLSGVVVAVGACAGALAVPGPVPWPALGLLCLWLAAWEIGGRNIPNDFVDAGEDTRLGIRTVPVVLGPAAAVRCAAVALLVAGVSAVALALYLTDSYGVSGVTITALATVFLLLGPGVRLLREPSAAAAMAVFNRATWHPPAVLAAFAAALALPR
ncbi:UbiA prenyltransferase family protein [Streptomyces roseirectus]|uniref:UbiA prenyltransferase family protein n=1 Tax=Streptomyces roseirectus TaxID=2768066 RepID=A0A7H0IS73_9ACTN|nr:UbiA prenyltransferase family protein [Streptomyces roseirectus]